MCVEGKEGDTIWLFAQILSFGEVLVPGSKPKFYYRLPKVGGVCRSAWVLAAGFTNPNNSRVRGLEARIRKGITQAPVLKSTAKNKTGKVLDKTKYARSFLCEYALKHSQRSPVSTSL